MRADGRRCEETSKRNRWFLQRLGFMIPWVRENIVDAWHNLKTLREADRRLSALSSLNPGNSSDHSDIAMFVAAASAGESFSVNVISLEGVVTGIVVKPDFTVEKIKSMATKHFYGEDTAKPASRFRLVHATKFKQLVDDRKVEDEDIQKSDELILVEIRPGSTKENLTEEALKGPNEDAIALATKGMPIKNPPPHVPSADCAADFQNEIRKTLISLVQASAKILTHSPEAVKVYEVIRERLEARCKPPNDPRSVKHLMDMGFSERKVLKALHLRKMNTSEALEWLLEHGDDPEEEELELPPLETDVEADPEGPGSSGASGSSSGGPIRKKSLKEACMDLFKGGQNQRQKRNSQVSASEVRVENQGSKREPNLVTVVSLLLESFRQHKKLEFKPSPRILQSLQEMGFEEKMILDALRVTGNNQSNACEWLLGERRRSLHDFDEGLDPEGPIYKAIMSNPHIRLSLTSQKMLLAYLSMLETPSSANIWINDPEASPVLSQIFKTYHAEKHAIHMNRYSAS